MSGDLDGFPGILPREPEITIRLDADEAETVVYGLRGWVHFQARQDPETAAQTPVPEHDPWPRDMAEVADKVALAMREATGRQL